LAALRRLIPADVVSYGEFDLEGPGWRVAGVPWEGVPRVAMTPDIRQAHLQFTHQIPHPPWAPFAGRAVRWSDLISRPKLLRLDAYVEVGKPLDARFQLELWLRTPMGWPAVSRSTGAKATSASATYAYSTRCDASPPAMAECAAAHARRGGPAHAARA
ncbi:MAG: hypothetical protein M3O89_01780, partial [Actinomycetota bacterium]|nr:hypothetical protein [Actinomycetota bacterium]